MNSEFAIQLKWKSDTRQTASRWVLSHVLRHKLQIVVLLIGAIGNATGASIMFVLIGQAFNAVSAQPINYPLLSGAAWGIVLSQIIRGVLQLGRNFGSEVIGQRLERDTRHELYASLIGKSMTFHDQQSVGDVMARATNDVREINLMLNPGLNLVVGSFMFMVLHLVTRSPCYSMAAYVSMIAGAGEPWRGRTFCYPLKIRDHKCACLRYFRQSWSESDCFDCNNRIFIGP